VRFGDQPPVDSPTRVILTDDGASYFFSRRQRLQRFRLINGRDEFGLQLQTYRLETLYKLVAGGLVRKLQYPVADALSQRDDVVRYLSTLANAVLSRHAAGQLSITTRKSPLMIRWSRTHPKSSLGTPESAPAVARYLRARKDALTALRLRLTSRVRSDFLTNAERPIDPSDYQPVINRLIEQVSPEAWFLLVSEEGGEEMRDLFDQLAAVLVMVTARAELVDYLAIVWVELLVRLQHRSDQVDSEETPTAHLLAQMGTRDNGTRELIHLMASTDTARFAALRADLDEVAQGSKPGVQTLDQFLQFATDGRGELGVYYVGFLEEACRRLGVGLQTFVQGENGEGRLNMVMTF
jgi:hypothetical protein